jgi:hypothetical protein
MEGGVLGEHPGELEGAVQQPVDCPGRVAVGKVLKLGRLPVKGQLAGRSMPIRTDNIGQDWNIQLQLTPVIPKRVKEPLFK